MRTLMTLLLFTMAMAASVPGYAARIERGESHETAPPSFSVMQSDGVTLSEAIEQVKRQYNGRIVDAQTKRSGDREIHLIKVLTEDGKVKTVRVPGKRLS